MKKILVIFIVLFLIINFNLSAHSGCAGHGGGFGEEGMTAGIEFGIDTVNHSDDRMPYLKGLLSYGTSFFNNAFDLYSEINYTFGFKKRHISHSHDHSQEHHEHSHDDDEAFPQSIYFNLMLGYNLGIGSESKLSFILKNEFDEFIISPREDEGNNIRGIFTPSVMFNHEFDSGDLYLETGFPITYIQEIKNAGLEAGFDFTVGWKSLYGFGVEMTLLSLLAPNAGIDGLEFSAEYNLSSFYISVETLIPIKDMDHRGFDIAPEIGFVFKSFTFFAKCGFYHIGNESEHLHITPAAGFYFNFLRRHK